MDFFDAEKQKRHAIRLIIGYAIMGAVLILATTILLYRAYGFGLDKEGRVIQNGMVFISSRPKGADIYVNGKKVDNTNTRMTLPSGQYLMELKRDGYRDWKRIMTVEGGSVERFDYPVLFPSKLVTKTTKQYSAAPSLSSISLDRRWLLVSAAEQNTFDLFDLDAKNIQPQVVSVSSDILSADTTTTGWKTVEWSKDNRHVLLLRSYDKQGQAGSEYILFDRQSPELSQNLTVAFGFTPTAIELRDQAYDQYYLYDQNAGQVFAANLKQPTPQPYISGVLAFTSEKDTVAYVTAQDASKDKVLLRIKVKDDPSLTVRQMAAGTSYLLDMSVYDGKLYLVAGASSENRAFVYKDPVGSLEARPKEAVAPVQILKVPALNYVTFSTDKQFAMAENGNKFAVYDIENDRGYTYQVAGSPMDAPQPHAIWMDGFRLCYVSGGKVTVFDFDGTNLQHLSSASPNYLPIFDHNYRYLYTIDSNNTLTNTALLTPQDL